MSLPLILQFHTKPPPLRFLGTNYRNSLLLLPSRQHGGADFTRLPSSSSSSPLLPVSYLQSLKPGFSSWQSGNSFQPTWDMAVRRSYHGVMFYFGTASLVSSPVSLHQFLRLEVKKSATIPGTLHFCSSPSGRVPSCALVGGAKILENKIYLENKTCKPQFKEAGSVCTPSWEWLSTEGIGMTFYGSARLSLLTLPPVSFLEQPVVGMNMTVSSEQQCLVSRGTDHNTSHSGLLLKQ